MLLIRKQHNAENVCCRIAVELFVIISTQSCSRVQELRASWSTFPGHAAISAASFSCQTPPRHRFDDTSQPAIVHRYLLRLMLTRYFLFLSSESETVTVERCYTTVGASGKRCAKFMPVCSEESRQNTQSPLVLGGKMRPAPAACSDSQWRPFTRSTGKPPHHEVRRKSLRRGGRSQAAGISPSQSPSPLSSNVCVLTETVSETSHPRMTSTPPKKTNSSHGAHLSGESRGLSDQLDEWARVPSHRPTLTAADLRI